MRFHSRLLFTAIIATTVVLVSCGNKEIFTAPDEDANPKVTLQSSPPGCPWGTSTGNQISAYVSAGSSHTFNYSPWRSGNHYIWFINDRNSSNAGKIVPAWRTTSDHSWHSWSTWQTAYNWQRQTLHSGSADVEYQFTITSYNSATYWWFFCTD